MKPEAKIRMEGGMNITVFFLFGLLVLGKELLGFVIWRD